MIQAANVQDVDQEYKLWKARRDLKSSDARKRARALRLIDQIRPEEIRRAWVPGLGRSTVLGGIPGNNPKSAVSSSF